MQIAFTMVGGERIFGKQNRLYQNMAKLVVLLRTSRVCGDILPFAFDNNSVCLSLCGCIGYCWIRNRY